MKGKKNDYSMTFYNNEDGTLFMKFVHDTDKMIRWVDNHNIAWTHAMIYNRRTREALSRISNPRRP